MQANVDSLSQANQKTSYVYWLHLKEHTDVFLEGYVGVTTRSIDIRVKEHISKFKSSYNSHNPLHLALSTSNLDSLIITRLCVCSESEAYYIEKLFRPFEFMGWNTSEGGKLPDSIRYKINSNNSNNSINRNTNATSTY
jgi:hypothetical protein